MKKINMNELVKQNEDVIYKTSTVEIKSLGIKVIKYMPIEEKYGLVNRIFNMLYDEEQDVYDYVNARFLVPIMILEAYSDDIEFPENLEELDATGIFDYLNVSGGLVELKQKIKYEIYEIKNMIEDKIKISYRLRDLKSPLTDLIGDVSGKNPEDVEKMTNQIKELMEDENVRNMVEFKNRADV